jgi:hypothetical protein
MFGAFGDVKKRQPVFTFKRGTSFSLFSDHDKRTVQQPQQLQQKQPQTIQESLSKSQLHISPSSSNSTTDSDDPFDFPIATHTSSIKNTKASPDKQEKKADEEGEKDDSIFDFPDSLDEFSEVKLMVASTRTVQKLTRTRSKPKTKPKNVPPMPIASKSESIVTKKRVASFNKKASADISILPTTTISRPQASQCPPATNSSTSYLRNANHLPVTNTFSAQPFDIFAFDPSPPSHLSYKQRTQFTPHNPLTTNSNRYAYIGPPTSNIDPGNFVSFNNALPINNIPTINTSNWHHPVSISSLLNDTTEEEPASDFFPTQASTLSSSSTAQPVEKKRKRNIVAQLKNANGEIESNPTLNREFDFLSDEEEFLEQNQLLPLCDIIAKSNNKEKSPSPELSYSQKMELELESLMQSEFAANQVPPKPISEEAQQRRRYEPVNKIKVRVTFQKK